jgi:biopolymer transport protein ExbD
MIEFPRTRRRTAEVDLTPLIDVVFQLLVFFLLTSAFISNTIPMELPQAATGQQTSATLAVSLDHNGQIFLDAIPVTPEELRTRVRAAREAHKELQAVIAADGRITHAQVVRVIDILRQERISKFAINVRPDDLER